MDLVENTWSIFGFRKKKGGKGERKSHPQMSLKKKEASGRNCSCSGKKNQLKMLLKLWPGCDGKMEEGLIAYTNPNPSPPSLFNQTMIYPEIVLKSSQETCYKIKVGEDGFPLSAHNLCNIKMERLKFSQDTCNSFA